MAGFPWCWQLQKIFHKLGFHHVRNFFYDSFRDSIWQAQVIIGSLYKIIRTVISKTRVQKNKGGL